MSDTGAGGLAGRPTGTELCAELALLDPHTAADEQLLDQLTAQSRQLAYQQAQLWTVMAEIAVRDPSPNLPGGIRWTSEQIFASAADEIRAELRLTRRAAQTELATADGVARLPRILQALTEGVIDRRRAIVLAEGCLPLTDTQAGVLLDQLLPDAATVTATRLAEKVQTLAMALDPAWAEHRYRHAIRDRKIVGYLNPDGTATIAGQNLPADQAAAACARVDDLADTAKRAGAAAKIDHLRADLFLGLLDGHLHGMTEQAIITELLHRYPKTPLPAEEPAPKPVAEAAIHRPRPSEPTETVTAAAESSTAPTPAPGQPTDRAAASRAPAASTAPTAAKAAVEMAGSPRSRIWHGVLVWISLATGLGVGAPVDDGHDPPLADSPAAALAARWRG